jgi:hypothetical protein
VTARLIDIKLGQADCYPIFIVRRWAGAFIYTGFFLEYQQQEHDDFEAWVVDNINVSTIQYVEHDCTLSGLLRFTIDLNDAAAAALLELRIADYARMDLDNPVD